MSAKTLPVVLSIAGSDSGGGAGIQADLHAIAANGAFATTAITALTAQNTRGVTAVSPVAPGFVRAQVDAVASDMRVAAIKTGMLGDAALIGAVADAIAAVGAPHVVVDPVMVATSGDPLLPDAAAGALTALLLPRATLVTPNLHEAARLLGRAVHTVADAEAAARDIAALGPAAVLVKGGHLEADGRVVDVLWDGATLHHLDHPRLDTPHTHGTGCTLASAIAARLACGDPLVAAVREARAYVQGAIAGGLAIGGGHGPTDHLWFVDRGRRFGG